MRDGEACRVRRGEAGRGGVGCHSGACWGRKVSFGRISGWGLLNFLTDGCKSFSIVKVIGVVSVSSIEDIRISLRFGRIRSPPHPMS